VIADTRLDKHGSHTTSAVMTTNSQQVHIFVVLSAKFLSQLLNVKRYINVLFTVLLYLLFKFSAAAWLNGSA